MSKEKTPRWWNDKTLFVYHFARSNYITAFWNWFMGLAGKAAEPFLFVSVLYSGYKLLPGVPQPTAGLDAVVFVAQQATLDIGGMGLMKLAQQANQDKHSFAYRVGFILVGLMIANVVVASIARLVPLGNIETVIEGILLVARAIMAVLYGHAIHALRGDDPEPTEVVKSVDVHAYLDEYIRSLGQFGQSVERQFQQTETRIQRVTEALQLLATNSDNRILSVVRLIQASGAETEGRMLDLAEALRSHVDRSLAPIVTELNEQAETLSALSALSAQIGQFEATARVEWQEVKVTVEKHLEVLPKLAESIVSSAPATHRIVAPKAVAESKTEKHKDRKVKGSVTSAPNTSGEPFDKREFIRECLREDPGVSISVIQQKALLHGQTIASGYVSEVRKAFFEEQRETVIEAAEG